MYVEVVVFIILLIVYTYIAGFLLDSIVPTLPDACKRWNDMHVMEITLLIAGTILFYTHQYCTSYAKSYVDF